MAETILLRGVAFFVARWGVRCFGVVAVGVAGDAGGAAADADSLGFLLDDWVGVLDKTVPSAAMRGRFTLSGLDMFVVDTT